MSGFMGHISLIGEAVPKANLTDTWKSIDVEVDSGAITHICNKDVGSEFPIKPTEFSIKGGFYRAANGTKIYNQGERHIQGLNND